MSQIATDWAIDQLSISQRGYRVLCVMSQLHKNSNRPFQASLKYLMYTCDMSEATVVSAINDLKNCGLINVLKTYKENGQKDVNQYTLNLDIKV